MTHAETERRMTMEVSYSQIAVFDAAVEEPFGDWTEDAVVEGLSASERSVSFATSADGSADVSYEIGTSIASTTYAAQCVEK